MSGKALKWRDRQTKIGDGILSSLLAQLCWAHMDGKPLFISQGELAARCGMCVRAAHNGLKLLAEFGVLSMRKRHRPDGGQSSNEITLNFDATFHLSKATIRAARQAKRPPCTKRITPLHVVRTNKETTKKGLIQGEAQILVEGSTHARPMARLTVIDGGRP
jgi:hypothetical protein